MPKKDALLAETIGRQSEQIVLTVAKLLYLEGADPLDTDEVEPELTVPFSKDDLNGIDLWVATHKGFVGIQIKSSDTCAEEFIKKHDNGKVIPAVVVNTQHSTVESIKRDLLSAIRWAEKTWYPDD